jgi:murein DD-endopeptidase MepM/ murein hydrolase activator NlpD
MLSQTRFPYTGPCFGPGAKQTLNYSTVKGLKRGFIRLGLLDQKLGEETDDYGPALAAAMRKYQRREHLTANGNYGRGEYASLRDERLTTGPHQGEYALDSLALKYIRDDVFTICYPHPDVDGTWIGQGLHETSGITGNWAIDFMAHGGTPVLAPERARVTRFSGHDPRMSPSGPGIWGWSIYFVTATGYNYFSTHYSVRTCRVGQVLEVGQQLGLVGDWPNDPGRSHTHLGCSSVRGTADAKRHILAISQAAKLPPL